MEKSVNMRSWRVRALTLVGALILLSSAMILPASASTVPNNAVVYGKQQLSWYDIVPYTKYADFQAYLSAVQNTPSNIYAGPYSVSFTNFRDFRRSDPAKATYLSFEFFRITTGAYNGTHMYAAFDFSKDSGEACTFRVGYYVTYNGQYQGNTTYFEAELESFEDWPELIAADYQYIRNVNTGGWELFIDMSVRFPGRDAFYMRQVRTFNVEFVQGIKPSNANLTFDYYYGVNSSMIRVNDKWGIYTWLRDRLDRLDAVYTPNANIYDLMDQLWGEGYTAAFSGAGLTQQLMYAIIDAPLNMIAAGLNFEIFGFNLAGTILALLSILVIYAIVRAIITVIGWIGG